MKRTIWSAALAMVVAGAVAIPVIAQPAQGGRGQGRGPAFDRAVPLLRGLNLTEAQREQIRSITEAQRTGDNPRRNVMDLQRQLHAALFAEAPDQAKIDELKNSIAAARAAELTARIDLQSRIAQVLTPEQRAQAREALAKGPGQRGTRGPGRRGARSE
jgi:Spy/CpxP family protein refolding chaperone